MKYTLAFMVSAFTLPALAQSCEPDNRFPLESYKTEVLALHSHHVWTEITINAPKEKVWAVLTDFENMPNWSSSLQGITGEIKDGGQTTVTFKMRDRTAKIPHKIQYQEGVQFGWAEEIGMAPGIADNHFYRVEALSPCQTRFIQSDTFTGTSTAQPKRTTALFAQRVLPVYRAFNQQLKNAVESTAQP